MYQQFFGLRELPFELTPNPKFLYLPPRHREALSTLEYGLSSAKGVTALIGEAGTGKTTLLHAALASERCRHVNCVYLMNPTLTRDEFVEMLSLRFDLGPLAARSKASLLHSLEAVLAERRASGRITALVIDEAQSLSDELLEEVRLLANSETSTEKLLPVVLAGQPELKGRLNETGLRQLKQRVTLRCEIGALTLQEAAAYIAYRIRAAGGEASRVFSREAVILIYERSGGIPRTISVICDNALLTAFGLGQPRVDSDIVLEVARDLDLASGHVPETFELYGADSDPVASVPVSSSGILESAPAVARAPTEAAPAGHSLDQPVDDTPSLLVARASRFSLFSKR